MRQLRLIYLPNKMLLADMTADSMIEHNKYWYIPWTKLAKELKWIPAQSFKNKLFWQHGLVEFGQLKHNLNQKSSPTLWRGKIPNPLFPLSFGRLIIARGTQGIVVEEYNSEIPYEDTPLSWLDQEIRNKAGDLRINQLINKEFELIDHKADEQSTLYKHFNNGRLFQLLILPKEEIGGHVFEQEWIFSEVTHPQWAYSYLHQKERKKRGHNDILGNDYLQMLEEDKSGLPCQQEGCHRLRIRHSSLCKYHHFEAVMGVAPDAEE